MLYDFFSAFNTIHPLPSPHPPKVTSWEMTYIRVDSHQVTWITDCLTRLKGCTSDTLISSTEAPQGAVPSPVLFALSTADFWYNSEYRQNHSDAAGTSWNWKPSRPRRWWTFIRQNTISNLHQSKGARWRRGKHIDTWDWTGHQIWMLLRGRGKVASIFWEDWNPSTSAENRYWCSIRLWSDRTSVAVHWGANSKQRDSTA